MIDPKIIKPEHLWYFIGLIVTDGNLSKDGRHISLTSKDREHLFLVRNALGLRNIIGFKARGYSKDKKYSVLQFGDVHFYKYLQSIGLTPKKSLTLKKILIDKVYFKDFLRGVIDGDGYITTWKHRGNGLNQWALGVVSAAPLFIQWLKDEIENDFRVKGKLYTYKHRGRENPMNTLKFGKLAGKIILKSIYYEGALCLERKKKKHLECLLDVNRMVNYGGVIGPGAETGRQPRLKIE